VLNQRVQSAHRLLDRSQEIVAMNLVQIDMVGLQPAQTRLDRVHDVAAGGPDVIAARADTAVDLGRDHHMLPRDLQVLQRLSEDLLALTLRIDIRGIEEIDPALDRCLDQLIGIRLANGADDFEHSSAVPEGHRSEAQFRDQEARIAEGCVFHGVFSICESKDCRWEGNRLLPGHLSFRSFSSTISPPAMSRGADVRNLDFTSWPALLSTLFGLSVITLIGVGIRLLAMQTMQQRRERENRQINERLRTLIAAYKTLGGSFTGDLAVDPAHRRDFRGRLGSDRSRRIRDAVEGALSDIVLLGTEEQVRLAAAAATELAAGRPVETAALVVSLREFIRQVLDLQPVPSHLSIPKQGPARAMPSKGGKEGEKDGAKQGGGGLGGGAGGGGLGGELGHDEEAGHHDE
jgi:hypothetical protein